MSNILYVNAAFREGSRTGEIAEAYLKKYGDSITEINLGKENIMPLNADTLKIYNDSVAKHDFSHSMFSYAKQFANATEIVMAAPFWNFGIPAVLHNYLELVCTQGITFDISNEGVYFSKCHIKELIYITTSGGYIPDNDHAFGYIRDLAKNFWNNPNIRYISAQGLDVFGIDVREEVRKTVEKL